MPVPLVIIGYVSLLPGLAGTAILRLEPNDECENLLYVVAGVLLIISVPPTVLEPAAWIVLYVAPDDAIRKPRVPLTF